MNLRTLLSKHVKKAMNAAGVPETCSPHVTPSKNPKFGDYQVNGAMAAGKLLKTHPRDLALEIINHLTLDAIAEKIEIAGPGFINIHLNQKWLAEQLTLTADDERLGIPKKHRPQIVVVDYSAPNLAKEMHVGHLRSTIIGDAMARVLEFTGDTVIRKNHVGDWGTQFGMLIAELESHLSEGEQAELALQDLESFYQQAKKHFDEDTAFAHRAREYVVRLQSGDRKIIGLWEKFKAISLSHCQEIYQRLHVTLQPKDVHGESAYNEDLPVLVNELQQKHLAIEDQGAQVVFLEELADKDGKPSPVIIQKKDGGYLYATTDLAAIRHRVGTLKANRLIYFIDDRQSLHMKQVFVIARKALFAPEDIALEHYAFGKMLGKDKKPFKTRAGGTVKLSELLEEAVEKAAAVVQEKNTHLDEEEVRIIAENVGIGAVKYSDLMKTRTHDYVFDWDTILSLEGNTGPYMQYAYARICSIFRNAGISLETHRGNILIETPQEKVLTMKLTQFPEVIEQVAEDAFPHALCAYLYEVASVYMSFYEACPILKVKSDTKTSRLQLCKTTANTLKLGLKLLGINVMDRM